MEDVTVTTRGTQDMPFSGTMRTEPSSLGGEGLHHQWIPEPTSMDSQREFEKLKERGLYRAGGLEPPKKSEVESPIQVVKEVSPVVEVFYFHASCLM
ncbi:hypothetical protein HMI54_011412 [Coelomomyces lativittatus]|nr:hypothetical protein HMI54_011412 [Coelomomyces lativittatus]KAJ1501952.1 hypothetical protein HMI55_003135 [Coelomomyces lativittatus]